MRLLKRIILCRRISVSLCCSCLLFLSACASRPILFPNEYYKEVGKERAEKDIDNALKVAKKKVGYSADLKRDIAGGVTSAAVGAGAGVATGAITGSLTAGAISGIASCVTSLIINVIIIFSQPSEAYQSYVDRILQNKGYEVTGWN